MSMTLGTVITAARDRHPAFHRSRVPNAVLARFLTGYQRRLISKVAEVDRGLVAQQASISFLAVKPENALGIVGAGTAGGLPGSLTPSGGFQALAQVAGSAVERDFPNGQVLVSDLVATGFDPTYIENSGAAWTVNAYQNKYVWITAGTGFDQKRLILSNTATRLVISTGSDGQQWTTLPNASSIFRVVVPVLLVSEKFGVLTQLMPTGSRSGYLVRLDAQGLPFLDLTAPLVANFDEGIDLPPFEMVIGGTIKFLNDRVSVDQFRVQSYANRTQVGYGYGGWLEGGKLFLSGRKEDWALVDSIDLRYIPIAPDFTALTDLFLLPDSAYDPCVCHTAFFAAQRVNGLPNEPRIELSALQAQAEDAEATFINGAGRHRRAFAQHVKTVW